MDRAWCWCAWFTSCSSPCCPTVPSSSILGSDLNQTKIASNVTYALIFFSYLYAFFLVCSECQDLLDKQEDAADTLGRMILLHKKEWSEDTRDLADYVLDKYSKKIPVSPYGFFELNRCGFLSTIALVLTYLIVLLQFKTTQCWQDNWSGFQWIRIAEGRYWIRLIYFMIEEKISLFNSIE